jgi:hypothetical protein
MAAGPTGNKTLPFSFYCTTPWQLAVDFGKMQ